MQQRDTYRPRGSTFIAVGVLLLLIAPGISGCQAAQGRAAEPSVVIVTSRPTAGPAPTQFPTATLLPLPTFTPIPSPTPVPSATPTSTPVPSPTPVPGTKPARLLIPDLKLDVPVADMTWKAVNTNAGLQSEWEVPEYAAGWAVNSALLGEPSNVVLSGHNNIFGRVFMAISQAWPASGTEKIDTVTDGSPELNGQNVEMIGADGRHFNYVITGFYRIRDSGVSLSQRESNGKWMDPTDRARLTITTCWPPWSNTHRLVVVADPVQ